MRISYIKITVSALDGLVEFPEIWTPCSGSGCFFEFFLSFYSLHKGFGLLSVTNGAESPEVSDVALTTAFYDGNSVVRLPKITRTWFGHHPVLGKGSARRNGGEERGCD